MHHTLTQARTQSWERLSVVPLCISTPEFLRIQVSYSEGPIARYLGPMSVIVRNRRWDGTFLQHCEIPNPHEPRKRVLVGSCRAEGVYCRHCLGGIEGEGVFVEMRDGEHGPFCSDSCADSWAWDHDDREGLDPLEVYKGATE